VFAPPAPVSIKIEQYRFLELFVLFHSLRKCHPFHQSLFGVTLGSLALCGNQKGEAAHHQQQYSFHNCKINRFLMKVQLVLFIGNELPEIVDF
jgi:hypothetical protein